jgi:hypothetical protein
MTRARDALIWGIILLIVGLGFLLWNFGVFESLSGIAELVIAGLFALLGVGFLLSYLVSRHDWWRVIPGFALLSVGAIIFLSTRGVAGLWLGVVLFIGLALAFAVVYFTDRRERWWALIPFGAMVVMVATVLLNTRDLGEELLGAVLFGGMGLVFFLIYALSPDRAQFRWALIPTSVLLIMGLVSLAADMRQSNPASAQWVRLWPILLIGLGVVLLGFAITRAGKPAPPVVEIPAQPPAAETVAAPGAGVYVVPETPVRIERSPVTLYEPAPTQDATASAAPAGEVEDIYDFLQSAPGPSS